MSKNTYRRTLNRLRRRHAGKNGVIPSYAFDIPWLEATMRRMANKRLRRPRIEATGE